jgi:hypothetical protein
MLFLCLFRVERKKRCWSKWHSALYSKSDETTERAGKWTTDEDSTLTDAVEKHNGNDWSAISELFPGRTSHQCWNRWHDVLVSKSDDTTTRKRKWTTDEDSTLTDAVEKYNGADWAAISKLVPGRTKQQCNKRWHDVLDSKSDETTARKRKWTTDEDVMLNDAVKKRKDEDWAAISKLVPGRTNIQFHGRWNTVFDSKSDETIARACKWTTDEDSALTDAEKKHNGEDWAAISKLVPGRTRKQCRSRWNNILVSNSDETTARAGK